MKRCLRVRLVVAVVISLTGFSTPTFAQTVSTTNVRSRVLETLALLRDDRLEDALISLGAAVDLSPSLEASNDQGLAAAAGGVHRVLRQRSENEQFDLLYKWTMPGEGRTSVRILSSPVPQTVPPSAFARVLGERPRDDSFAISSIGGIRGLFSSGWMLVLAAREVGRLRNLTAELEQLAEQEVVNADVLLLFARLADRRANTANLLASLNEHFLTGDSRDDDAPAVPLDGSNIALAAAALEHEELRPLCETLFQRLIEQSNNPPAPRIRAFLRVAQAAAVQLHRGESTPEALYRNRLKYWVPVTDGTAIRNAGGTVSPMWLVHENHLLHLAGPGNDVLFCRFPLVGDFEFTCETQEGGVIGTDGGLVYGGLQFEARASRLSVGDADFAHSIQKPCPFVRHAEHPTFNRVSIASSAKEVKFAVNLHPMWYDDASATSPWLGLRSFGAQRPIFRNLKIRGDPTIPREVPLSQGNELRGWQAGFFAETQPAFGSRAESSDTDWSVADGVIIARGDHDESTDRSQSLLRYQKPLLAHESIRYEFFYEPNSYEVHPALGRLAFLVEPSGVRIHWITDGPLEWTGLPENNTTLEPLNRRGGRPLPLNEGQWNTVQLTHQQDAVTLSLNGTLIYHRRMDFEGNQMFGLYRDPKISAKVRKVVMSGDWPETLPQEFLRQPATVEAAAERDERRTIHRHMLNRTFGEHHMGSNLREIRRQASKLAPKDRFEFLSKWVLPEHGNPPIRVSGEFVPTDSPPLAAAREIADPRTNANGESGKHRGGTIASPIFDLLDVAMQIDRLEELLGRIHDVTPATDEHRRRARAALVFLINMELGEKESAYEAFDELYALGQNAGQRSTIEMWPETLVVYRGVQRFADDRVVAVLLNRLYAQRHSVTSPTDVTAWHTHIAALFARRALRQAVSQDKVAKETSEETSRLQDWVPLKRATATTRGHGLPHPSWLWDGQHVRHLPGHHSSYLLFHSPLRGNFAIEADIGTDITTQLVAAGKYFGPRWSGTQLEIGTFRDGSVIEDVEPSFGPFDKWVRCRAVFQDGVRTIYLNGRAVHAEALPEDHEPWIGFRSWGRHLARVRNVAVTGTPQIPDAIVLSTSEDLTGWYAYHRESVGAPDAIWHYVRDTESTGQIVGSRRHELRGSFCESLLQYHRPLVEDGSVEFEFYYEPGQSVAHPALDRRTFLLDPDGVRVHWVTDGRFGTVPPDNVRDEPANRRGPEALPLEASTWNRLKLSVIGEAVQLELNDKLVYECELEPSNDRTFGLFHYADQNELRVRNVVWRGDWPKQLPAVSNQGLADTTVISLDAARPSLKAVFTHDFGDTGAPESFFESINTDNRGRINPGSNGIEVIRPGYNDWSSTGWKLRFSALGDFDIEAAFDEYQPRTKGKAQTMLVTILDDDFQTHCRQSRSKTLKQHQKLDASIAALRASGVRDYDGSLTACNAAAGRLRLARRGDMIYFLFVEDESSVYQLLRTARISDAPLTQDGIELRTFCNGTGATHVLWKSITVRAERLHYLPPQSPQRSLFVMNADGTDAREVTPAIEGFTHLGSPEWSPDNRKIALDMSNGSVRTSHIVVIDAESGEAKDLGTGCMPSYSRDATALVFSQPGEGVMMMNADGTNRKTLDRRGWGAQWSPDGKSIAYGKSGNLVVMDVEAGETAELLRGEHADRYRMIYWNPGWSHDSRWIAFKGHSRGTGKYELGVVSARPPHELRVLHQTEGSLNADFTWSPDNQRVLFSMHRPPRSGPHTGPHSDPRLFTVDRSGKALPELFPGQAEERKAFDCAWSPNGRWIAFSTIHTPKPTEWLGSQSETREATRLRGND